MGSRIHPRRGRPTEKTEDDEVKRRRQRGRLAQQAFRQRQVDAIARLETELASLKSSVQEVKSLTETLNRTLKDTARHQGPRPADHAVQQAMDRLRAKLRGITSNLEDPTTVTDPVGTINRWDPNVKRPSTPQDSSRQMLDTTVDGDMAMSVATDDSNSNLQPYSQALSLLPKEKLEIGYDSGRLSPRLNYGLWFEPDLSLPILVPPEDIVPFLDGSVSPFAAKLYWTTMRLAFSVLRSYWRRRGANPQNLTILAQQIFGMSLQYSPGDVIEASIHARLGFYLQGMIEPTHPGRDPVNAAGLYYQIQSELRLRGETMQHWLDAREVESLIEKTYGFEQAMLLRAASTAGAHGDMMEKTNRLVERLARQSVCFGDGPRYPVHVVAPTVQFVFDQSFEEVTDIEGLSQ